MNTEPPGTRPYLIRRLAALLIATALAFGALMAAYYGVGRNAAAVTDRTAPAIVEVEAARKALNESYTSLAGKETAEAEGVGETYGADLNAARQHLVQAGLGTVADKEGRETLRTATGQVSSYDFLIQQAARSTGNDTLRDAYLGYAGNTLRKKGSGIVPRLENVQLSQRETLADETSFDGLLWFLWITAYVLCAVLVWLLVDTQRTLRRRFRRKLSPPLVGATALVALVLPLLTFLSSQIQHSLKLAAGKLGTISDPAGTLPNVEKIMGGTHWRAAVASWIPLAAVVLAALVVAGLQPRIEEYRFGKVRHGARPRPRALTRTRMYRAGAGLLALCLVLLGSVVNGGLPDLREGRVTVLASWTGDEEKRFREVLDRFGEKEDIEVIYQGTTSLRDVLLSRVDSGDAPDIAILPSLGEAAEYTDDLRPLGKGLAEPLKDYKPLWTAEDDAEVRAVPVKVSLKSIVWHDKARSRDLTTLASQGARWCAGMGGDATSGWPGTDWIEDILLQRSGKGTYMAWARGELPWASEKVREAWRLFGERLGTGPARTALRQDYTHGPFPKPGERSDAPGCELQHQGSFIRTTYRDGADATFTPSRDLLPEADRTGTAREISADFATLFGKSAAAEKLMRFLTGQEAQRIWAKPLPDDEDRTATPGEDPQRPFFLTFQEDLPEDSVNARVDKELHARAPLCLDASDVMPPRMRSAFQHGVLDYLSSPDAPTLKRVLDDLDAVRADTAKTPHADPPRVCN
ncbi:hypothetical protein [Streptomyces albireticuli]|uniref:Uncharacterized protein n=1 Tax=Streptomyces albireticuli TaxID=1940 RepID=A0A2A2D9K6_9ACTN|nr:hypothetical protein [Streptomyces albireticuli]MCD9144395.1 hypothetical protein [Streptomyces albireticuli]MCD9163542.1 hypothetical protein [Streptomyces albireticuli]MCD9193072.1 hypothetical protein [Streptomyces albireticuli]PAU48050.1 hypothetical protein CK936_15390 [Streptomyces albireticuli]